MSLYRKGENQTLEVAVEIVLAATIVIFGYMMVNNVVGDSNLHRKYYAKDISLLADGVLAAPGNVNFPYEIRSKYAIEFNATKNRITFYDESDEPVQQRAGIEQPYASDPNLDYIKSGMISDNITIVKNQTSWLFKEGS